MTGPHRKADGVLATLNDDGSRRWLAPRLSEGRFYRRRRVVGYGLIALFCALPLITVNNQPAVLLDIAARRFVLFGVTFLATDTMLLMLLMISVFVGIFLLTALYGRAWCGWGCPQTVYLEFLFRPVERAILGREYRRTTLGFTPRWLLLMLVWLLLALFIAHTFLAWFVGVDALKTWITQSPLEHPTGFLVMAATTGLMLLDFAWFREQMCTVACPYGRFQAALLDRRSTVIGYDTARGEPRGKGDGAGDCIDCKACVVTCPTGIDIRDGLQMECVACAQCVDACDAIMTRLDRPLGLVRYASQSELAGDAQKPSRVRAVIYSAILLVLVGALVGFSLTRSEADISVLRGSRSPYEILPSGDISNSIKVRIQNRTGESRTYTVAVPGTPEGSVASADNPLEVAPSATGTIHLVIVLPADRFDHGQLPVTVRVTDDGSFETDLPYKLLGPKTK